MAKAVPNETDEEQSGRGLLAPMTAAPLEVDVDVHDPRRQEIRQWLVEHPSPSGRQLAQAGLVAPHWPAPWGRGADVEYQLLIDDELSRAKVQRPINPIGIGWAGPTILYAGTQAQQQEHCDERERECGSARSRWPVIHSVAGCY